MKYVLITPSGRQFVYHVLGCAELFQKVLGGQIHCVDVPHVKEL